MRIENSRFFQLLTSKDSNKVSENVKSEKENMVKKQEKDVYNVNLSSKELNNFFEMAKQADEVRHEKVNNLKNELQNEGLMVSGKDVVLKVLGDK